jgi:Leucine-rich repeat (LRR) protein
MSLLLIAGLAVVLGCLIERARRQERAVEAIRKYGGFVRYDWESLNGKLIATGSPWGPRWVRNLLKNDHLFQTVVEVNLVYRDFADGTRVDVPNNGDEIMEQVAKLSDLRSLLVHRGQATDRAMRQIGKLRGLEQLYMWDAQVSDEGIEQLCDLRELQKIHCSNARITDKSIAVLAKLPRLAEMSLQGNHFTNKALEYLSGAEQVQWLHLGLGRCEIDDDGLEHAALIPNLRLLDVQQSLVTDEGLLTLKRCTKLREVWASGNAVTPEGKNRLKGEIPNIAIMP